MGTPEFWLALGAIIFIDLILAGDNAIVIGLAARNLPAHQQRQAIFWGTAGAIGIRALATILIVYLLKIPFILLIGGLVLIWISYKLLVEEKQHGDIQAGSTLWASIRTIIIADAAMGIDNIIAVAGVATNSTDHASHNLILVIIGLLITVPIIVWGSTLFIKLINRFAWIVYAGSGILAFTAAKMVANDDKVKDFFLTADSTKGALYWSFVILITAGVLIAAYLVNQRRQSA